MAFRWWILLRALEIRIPYKSALRLHFHGLFFSSFLPSSSGGDVIRAWYVTRHTDKRGLSALSVFVDRFTGLLSTALTGAITYCLFFVGQPISLVEQKRGAAVSQNWTAFWILLVCLFFLSVFFLWAPKGRGYLLRIYIFLVQMLKRVLSHIREVLSVFLKKWWLFPVTIFLTFFFQSLTFISFWLIGLQLGVEGRLEHYFAFFPLVWIVGVIPASIAGLGIMEGGVVFLFVKSGASLESATALAVCQRVLFLVGAFPGIWVHLKADYLPGEKDHIFIDGGHPFG